MRSLLKILAVTIFVGEGLASPVEMEKRDNITLKAPIEVPFSEHWEGVDGTWSTFEIRVGTPEQVYRVLPATSWQEIWVIYGPAANVCDTSLGVAANCQDARGGVFSNFTSTTWEQGKQYTLGVDTNLGESGEGQYGFDTVGLGYTNDTGPTLTHQIVSAIVSDTFWFGMLGLGFQPTNFSGYGDPQASFSGTLYTNGYISSMSWSYTAGAYYRLKSVFGSLIFGGYDASRFTPNDVVFTMTGDNLRDIVLTIRSITATTASGNTTLMSTPEFAFIDSVVPELWLPVEVCQQFEKALGISLDNTTSTYLVNASTHENLLNLNPNITFTLGNQKTGGPTVDIVLPYASFDLNVTAPILPNSSFYFPLMQATDESQYTLGRTFLQEAYVIADYNSRTFNVSQCVFDDSIPSHVIAIPSVQPTSTGNSTSGSGSGSGSSLDKLDGGAIAGIVIGALAGLFIIGSILFCCLRGLLCFKKCEYSAPSTPIHEIDTGKGIEKNSSAYSQQASGFTSEVSGQDAKVEIQGNPIMHPQELEADVPMMEGSNTSERVSGPSDSSRETGVSSLSPIQEHRKTPMAELGENERGLGESPEENIVSPATPTGTMFGDSMMGRAGPDIRVSSPTVSSPNEATWRPSTLVQRTGTKGSRFEERWS